MKHLRLKDSFFTLSQYVDVNMSVHQKTSVQPELPFLHQNTSIGAVFSGLASPFASREKVRIMDLFLFFEFYS